MIALFRKKPVVIEAIQFKDTAESIAAISDFTNDTITVSYGEGQTPGKYDVPILTIPTLEGDHRASVGDWIIKGIKGEFYPCKPDIFDATYDVLQAEPIDCQKTSLTFGVALEALKKGLRVAREGWNGKGMWLYLISGSELQSALKYGFGEYLMEPTIVASIAMKTADNKIVIGWLASQTDMLAEDWTVVE
jgi:hypothetical protein